MSGLLCMGSATALTTNSVAAPKGILMSSISVSTSVQDRMCVTTVSED